jgi:hypothetical protein
VSAFNDLSQSSRSDVLAQAALHLKNTVFFVSH